MCSSCPELKDYNLFLSKLSDAKTMDTVHEIMDILAGKGLTTREIKIILGVTKTHVENFSVLPQDLRETIRQGAAMAQDQSSEQT